MLSLPSAARYVPSASASNHRLVLFDVMDTLVADPFFRGFEKDLFGLDGGIQSLFAIKDQKSFVAFEKGEISEAEHFETCAHPPHEEHPSLTSFGRRCTFCSHAVCVNPCSLSNARRLQRP